MPSSRRRKFSVQNEGGGRIAAPKDAAGASGSLQSPYNRSISNLEMKHGKCRSKMLPHCSKVISPLEIVAERVESSSSVLTVKMRVKTVDKDVTASSSNIDLFNIMSSNESTDVPISPSVVPGLTNRDARQTIRSTLHRDKPRQHRMKVRSPRRRIVVINPTEISKRSVATGAIDWMQEMEVYNNIMHAPPTHIVETETTEFGDRPSEHSLDDMCRICHGGESLSLELGQLISACNCRGTVGRVHVRCLERWLTESGKSRCELCGSRYATRRVHRYGVARALLMWILSQNAKQLMVDSLGIMLMSPLAVLAAWLSGRTLAGLMTQEGHVTPWPLASTFVLACMTLVCYYCWIVSAATRHALGWWIWYRSQYEVRLQLQDSEDAS